MVYLNKNSFIIFCISAFVLTGCTEKVQDTYASSEANFQESYSNFCTHTQKIKSELKIDGTPIKAVIEAYVDTAGNGKGLIEVGDIVSPITISNGIMTVDILGVIYAVEDIGAYLSFNFFDEPTVASDNVTISGGKISSIQGDYGGVYYINKYQESDLKFGEEKITIDKSIGIQELLTILNSRNSSKSEISDVVSELSEIDTANENEDRKEEPSFYLKSKLGVVFGKDVFSIGDKVNPTDYFKHLTPEGISFKNEWDATTKIVTRTISYLDTQGKFSILTIDDIVYEITTDANFTFLGLYKGQPEDEVVELLGKDLDDEEEKTFRPLYPGLAIADDSSDGLTTNVGDMTITFGFNDNKLSSIHISKDRGYLHYATKE